MTHGCPIITVAIAVPNVTSGGGIEVQTFLDLIAFLLGEGASMVEGELISRYL